MGSVTAPLMPIIQVIMLGLFVNMGVKVSLWASKCWQAPSKSYTIPRLESLSCQLLSKLIVTAKEAVECKVDLSGTFCWSDSEGLCVGLDNKVKNGMFGYKIELQTSDIIHLHLIDHMFHLISIHQTFPHDQYHCESSQFIIFVPFSV